MLGVWNIRLNVSISRFATRSRGDCDAMASDTYAVNRETIAQDPRMGAMRSE